MADYFSDRYWPKTYPYWPTDYWPEYGEITSVGVDFSLPAVQYKLRVHDADGVLKAEVTDFEYLVYRKRVNEAGVLEFRLGGDHAAIDLLVHRGQVEVWRRLPRFGVDWYRDFVGLFLDQERFYVGGSWLVGRCAGLLGMLDWRYVMWKAGTVDRCAFSAVEAETIMKTLVSYNAGANATTGNGRERTGTIAGLSVEADGGNGNSLDWSCAWKNLLGELGKLARVAGGDFDLVKTAAAAWEFRWFTGQRGTDRSAEVIFSLGRGNMGSPRYRENRMGERTVAVVAGQGQGDARAVEVRTGADYAAGNDKEVFVNAAQFSTASGLQAAGDEKLDALQARGGLSFEMLQTPACLYGKHYCIDEDGEGVLGDLVTARYDDIEEVQKIVGVTVVLGADGNEVIDVETETQ